MTIQQLMKFFLELPLSPSIGVLSVGLLTSIALICPNAHAAPSNSTKERGNAEKRAYDEFIKKNYEKAIPLYQSYLKDAPQDTGAANQLGASYYHIGLPKKALLIFKRVERRTKERSYNFFYQGLSYAALKRRTKAGYYFQYAAQYGDEYAARATFELSVLSYNSQKFADARHWAAVYIQRFPGGNQRKAAEQLIGAIDQGIPLSDIKGTEYPNVEASFYRYNSYSIINSPHYWYIQIGGNYVEKTGFSPSGINKIRASEEIRTSFIANVGIGAGPYKKGASTAWAGYNYKQNWVTDEDRIKTYFDEWTDFSYQPYRPDLLERRHQIYGDFRQDLGHGFFLGTFARLEFARIGSKYIPSPEDADLRRVLKISDTTLLIPWVGATYYRDFRSVFYMYMRKELNADAPETSNKTYNLGINGQEKAFSLGLSNAFPFEQYDIELGLDLFQYEFIYNDRWLDYTRRGFIVSFDDEFYRGVHADVLFGIYQDRYQLDRIKVGGCDSEPEGETSGVKPPSDGATVPENCPRKDTGMLYQLGIYWNMSQFYRLAGYYSNVVNKNAEQRVYDDSKTTYLVMFTMAFPSVKRVMRFVDRFSDSAFTKDPG